MEWCVSVPYSSGSCMKPMPFRPIHEKDEESVPPGEAVAWVREHYRSTAVETPWQRWWVAQSTSKIECWS